MLEYVKDQDVRQMSACLRVCVCVCVWMVFPQSYLSKAKNSKNYRVLT